MENPNNQVRLRRHSTLHPRLLRHSTMPGRARAIIGNRLNKNNPYVGFIRHSPSATDRLEALFQINLCASVLQGSKSFHSKSSPHIGWFRHAPPSRLQLKRLETVGKNIESLMKTYSKRLDFCKSLSSHHIDGKLKGGAPTRLSDLHVDFEALHRSLQDCEAGSPSATIQVLSRLAFWFLFPLAHDESSCGYHHDFQRPRSKPATDVPEIPLYGQESADGESDEDDDSSTDSIQTVGTLLPLDNIEARNIVVAAQYVTNDGLANSAATILSAVEHDSATATREAYSRDDSTNDLLGGGQSSFHSEIHFEDASYDVDFVITQMDIARMARNAARHLDVESIWNLPTTTYRRPTTTPTKEYDDIGDGSWFIIPEAMDTQPKHEAVCVICLESFTDGDRLRVLPCEHAFHMGCIDRWLSGSHSFVDCDTSGCPTCKKKPRGDSLDGLVPSWAFARLGESLASQGSTL